MRTHPKTHALAASARLANVPSVVGNVWLGIALAIATGDGITTGAAWVPAAALELAGVCLYLAGNFLNDWADRAWDASHRPERALPRGMFAARLYLLVAAGFFMSGLAAAAAVSTRCLVVALSISLFIGLYTRVHKRSAWAVVPMGLCRAMLPVLGFAGFASGGATAAGAWVALAAVACGLFLHIAGLSLGARGETLVPLPYRAVRHGVMFAAAGVAMGVGSWHGLSLPLAACALGILPYGLWIVLCFTVWFQPAARHVSNLLAGIPLVDWIVLLPLALTSGAADRWTAPFPLACLWISPLAWLAGKGLQRFAPAT